MNSHKSPLTSLPVHASSSQILSNTYVFMDLDGTLLPSNTPTIPKKATDVLYDLSNDHVKRILITGRNHVSTKNILLASQAQQHLSHTLPQRLFDFVVTSSGAAIADHDLNIIKKSSIENGYVLDLMTYLHKNAWSYFIQHDIPHNNQFHEHSFYSNDLYDPKTKNIRSEGEIFLIDDFKHCAIHDNSLLPPTFCVKQYNASLPKDHFLRKTMLNGEKDDIGCNIPFCSEVIDFQHETDPLSHKTLRKSIAETISKIPQLSASVSQFIVPVHPHTLVPLLPTNDPHLNALDALFPHYHHNHTQHTQHHQNTPHKDYLFHQAQRYRVHSQCQCCKGDYMIYTNPSDLSHHIGHNLYTELHSMYPEKAAVTSYRDLISIVHCTSPMDHHSLWIELLPAHINKQTAVQTILKQYSSLLDDSNLPVSPPMALFSFGNDFNDIPMMTFIQKYEKHHALLYNSSFMILTQNPSLIQYCHQHDINIIGKCEDAAVGETLSGLVAMIKQNHP